MSSITWTPHAVASESRVRRLPLWRTVEAQYVVATRPLVDTLAEQELLESVLESSKPPIPPACAGLDYLLYTPFRYPTVPGGSRFRGYGDPGVWYGAAAVRTSFAELGYRRWRFVSESRGLPRLDGVPHTLFQAVARGGAVDLRVEPFARDRKRWCDRDDYSACQAFARSARSAGAQIIRYESVRDPARGGCAAILDCRAFSGTGGVRRRQTWFLTVDRRRASWVRTGAARGDAHEFVFERGEESAVR